MGGLKNTKKYDLGEGSKKRKILWRDSLLSWGRLAEALDDEICC